MNIDKELTQEELTLLMQQQGYTPTYEKAISAFNHSRMLGKNLCELDNIDYTQYCDKTETP